MMFRPRPLDAAWVAGFYEGEGWIHKANQQGSYPVLSIAQKDTEPLERYAAAIGHLGMLRPKGPDMHVYIVRGLERVQAVVAMIWPWLSTRRRRQISAVLTAHVARKRERAARAQGPCPQGHLTHRIPIAGQPGKTKKYCPECTRLLHQRARSAVIRCADCAHDKTDHQRPLNPDGSVQRLAWNCTRCPCRIRGSFSKRAA